ncbi:helix-turn-helix domain-containing protein [Phascolarctobacterium sp.]
MYEVINSADLGMQIRIIRMQKGLNQLELAKLIGISQANMCNIEAGRVQVSFTNLLKLANGLNCDLNDFFRKDNNETKIHDIGQAVINLKQLLDLLK